MTDSELTPERANELADGVRRAHDEMLMLGHKKGSTALGNEGQGICLGTALAMAFNEKGSLWAFHRFTSSTEHSGEVDLDGILCAAGRTLTPFLRDAVAEVRGSRYRNSHEPRYDTDFYDIPAWVPSSTSPEVPPSQGDVPGSTVGERYRPALPSQQTVGPNPEAAVDVPPPTTGATTTRLAPPLPRRSRWRSLLDRLGGRAGLPLDGPATRPAACVAGQLRKAIAMRENFACPTCGGRCTLHVAEARVFYSVSQLRVTCPMCAVEGVWVSPRQLLDYYAAMGAMVSHDDPIDPAEVHDQALMFAADLSDDRKLGRALDDLVDGQ